MARDFHCPSCGEDEELRGRSTDTGIVLTCDSCGHEWPRDDTPRCATCGGTAMSTLPRAVLAGGRATVQSIVGRQSVPACATCDLEAIQAYMEHGRALPPGHVTAASQQRAADQSRRAH